MFLSGENASWADLLGKLDLHRDTTKGKGNENENCRVKYRKNICLDIPLMKREKKRKHPQAHCKIPKRKTKAQHISDFCLATMTSLAYLNGSKTYYKTSEKSYSLK